MNRYQKITTFGAAGANLSENCLKFIKFWSLIIVLKLMNLFSQGYIFYREFLFFPHPLPERTVPGKSKNWGNLGTRGEIYPIWGEIMANKAFLHQFFEEKLRKYPKNLKNEGKIFNFFSKFSIFSPR